MNRRRALTAAPLRLGTRSGSDAASQIETPVVLACDSTRDSEVVPMLGKASTTIDHVNDELEKVGHITDSAVDAADSLDSSVRTINSVLGTPARAVSGVSAGISQAFQSFRGKRGERGGVV